MISPSTRFFFSLDPGVLSPAGLAVGLLRGSLTRQYGEAGAFRRAVFFGWLWLGLEGAVELINGYKLWV